MKIQNFAAIIAQSAMMAVMVAKAIKPNRTRLLAPAYIFEESETDGLGFVLFGLVVLLALSIVLWWYW